MRTIGISPKVIASVATALSAFAAQWITLGTIDRGAGATLAVAIIGGVAAYLAPPGATIDASRLQQLDGTDDEPDVWGAPPAPDDPSLNADLADVAGANDRAPVPV